MGQEGSSYKVISEKFKESFKERGVDLELVPTSGLGEGLKGLDSDVSKICAVARAATSVRSLRCRPCVRGTCIRLWCDSDEIINRKRVSRIINRVRCGRIRIRVCVVNGYIIPRASIVCNCRACSSSWPRRSSRISRRAPRTRACARCGVFPIDVAVSNDIVAFNIRCRSNPIWGIALPDHGKWPCSNSAAVYVFCSP